MQGTSGREMRVVETALGTRESLRSETTLTLLTHLHDSSPRSAEDAQICIQVLSTLDGSRQVSCCFCGVNAGCITCSRKIPKTPSPSWDHLRTLIPICTMQESRRPSRRHREAVVWSYAGNFNSSYLYYGHLDLLLA